MVEKFISAITKSPATIATEINGTYVKNESTSVHVNGMSYIVFSHIVKLWNKMVLTLMPRGLRSGDPIVKAFL